MMTQTLSKALLINKLKYIGEVLHKPYVYDFTSLMALDPEDQIKSQLEKTIPYLSPS